VKPSANASAPRSTRNLKRTRKMPKKTNLKTTSLKKWLDIPEDDLRVILAKYTDKVDDAVKEIEAVSFETYESEPEKT
jgi:hypothetical protein